MKTAFSVLFGVLLMASTAAQAQFSFTTNNGAITITGYAGSGGAVAIPATINRLPVTGIAARAFVYGTGLTSVTIPGSVTNIGEEAFYDCYNLTKVTMPNGLTSIAEGVFVYCTTLASITIPNGVTSIGDDAFGSCYDLTNVTLPSSLTGIGDSAFANCTSLTNLVIPNGVTNLGKAAFNYCTRLASVTIPKGVASIGNSTFAACALTSVMIPNGITNIGDSAFNNCTSLTNLLIPGSVTSIGSEAFANCTSLTDVYFTGNAPANLGSYVFDYFDGELTAYVRPGTTGWTNFTQDTGIPVMVWNIPGGSLQVTLLPAAAALAGAQWRVDGGSWQSSGVTINNLSVTNHTVSFAPVGNWITPTNQTVSISSNATTTASGTYVREYPFTFTTNHGTINITGYVGSGGAVTIPSVIDSLPVTGISDEAFYGCSNISSVAIASSVTNIGYDPFIFCTNLTAITVDPHNPDYASASGVLFNKKVTILLQCPWGKTGSYPIPNGVAQIGTNAFDSCAGLTSLSFPDSLTNIASAGCADLPRLTAVILPEHLATLGNFAFENCPNLATVTLPASLITLGAHAFDSCASLTRITLPNHLDTVGDYAFYQCTGLTNVIFGRQLTNLGIMSFCGCSSLAGVAFDDRLSSIGDNAFDECNRLTRVTLPNQLSIIGGAAFADCQNLIQINLPASLTDLEPYAFYDCFQLTGVTLSAGLNNIADYTFYNCTSLTNFIIPNTIQNVGNDAFAGCTSLTFIAIPNSVTNIGWEAFYSCTSLTNVLIGNGVTQIGSEAFGACTSLGTAYFLGNAPEADGSVFDGDALAMAYDSPGASGWGSTFGGVSAQVYFPPTTGSLQVTINPPEAVSAGAQWAVDFGTWQNSGATVANVWPGSHTVNFYPVSGWLAPASQLVSVSVGVATNTSGAYWQLQTYQSAFIYLITNGTVTITGYNGPGGAVTIPATINGLPVTRIGLPGPVILAIPTPLQGVTVRSWAGNWPGVTSVTIPQGVGSVGPAVFANCLSLTNIHLPASVTNLPAPLFGDCPALMAITVDKNNPDYSSVGGVLFNRWQTTLLQCPEAIPGGYVIPNQVTSIGAGAFQLCSHLTSVTLPNSLASIGVNAFYDCTNLTGVAIPKNVTSIGAGAFRSCPSLTAISVNNNNPDFSSVSGVLFNKRQTTLLQYPAGLVGSYTIPRTVTSIGTNAFAQCTGLTGLTLPDSLTSLDDGAFNGCASLTGMVIPGRVTHIGNFAFEQCSGLTSLTLPNSVTSLGDVAFELCTSLTNITLSDQLPGIGNEAFLGCTALGGITIPNRVTNIGDSAFANCSELTGIMIPDRVVQIGENAFMDCSGLTRVTLPDSVTSIGNGAFENCSSLTSVTLGSTVTNLAYNAFNFCYALAAFTVDPNNPAYRSVAGVLFDKYQTTLIQCPAADNLGAYAIPGSVIQIADSAFYDCYDLTSVTIPGGVIRIGSAAFGSCSCLTSITIPDTVTTLGANEFQSCFSLTNALIGNGISSLGDGTFSDCYGLISVTLGRQVASIGANAFEYCSSLSGVTLSDSITNLGAGAFEYCTSLTNLALPGSISSIGSGAFSGCTGLAAITVDPSNPVYSSVDGALYGQNQTILLQYPEAKAGDYTIPVGVTNVAAGAFNNCLGLTSLNLPASVVSILIASNLANSSIITPLATPNTAITINPIEPINPINPIDPINPIYPIFGLPSAGNSAFRGCSSLTAIQVASGNPAYSSADGVLFNQNQTILLQYPEAKAGDYTIPDSVTNIASAAFSGCLDLTGLMIPGSVTSLGVSMFAGCPSLARVTISNGVTSIGEAAFADCSNLQSITIPNSVVNIGAEAFENCNRLSSLTIPGGVSNLGDYSFSDCNSLTNLYFLGNAPTADDTVFADQGIFFQGYEFYSNPTIYYDPGTSGWGLTFAGLPTVKLNTPTGSLQVNLTPDNPLFWEAQWQVDGGIWRNSGTTTIADLSVGAHTVGFSTVSGWVTPATQTVLVSSNATTTVTGAYVAEGTLQVTISPAAAANAGAEWSVNGGAYQITGTPALSFPTLIVTVSFKPIPGWTTPASQKVAIINGQATSLTVSYRDNLKPTLAIVTPPTSRLTVSNATYTVTGTAGDNAGLGGVWYQVNNGTWMLATTTNQWTNWSALLTLTPGTNTVHMYAEDINGDGFLYVADAYNNLIRKLTPAGVVTTLAGDVYALTNGGYNNDATAANDGYADGPGTNALFNYPNGTVVDGSGNLYVADAFNNLIRKVTAAGVVTTVAGDVYDLTNGRGNIGYADGTGNTVQFDTPSGVALDGSGNLYVADSGNSLIRKISPAGVVTTLAGNTNGLSAFNENAEGYGYADGPGAVALFSYPNSVAVDGAGNVYVADTGNHLIREITPDGLVSTLAGDTNSQSAGYADGPGGTALFNNPTGIAVDGSGKVYVADTGNHRIREITPDGLVSTLAGSGQGRYADGQGTTAEFLDPISVAADRFGTVFVVDQGNQLIRQITPTGAVTTLAGNVCDLTNTWYNAGYADGSAATALFNIPAGVAVDGSGGNCSPTNTLTIDYIPSSVLQVQIVGNGTVSPNYSNAVLALGNHYSLTAKPGNGFAFTNWTLSSPSLGILITNHATLEFTMVSNLTLTATFVDITRPTLTITSPKLNQVFSNSVIFSPGTNGIQPQIIVLGTDLCTVAGVAADNTAMAGVWYQLNTNCWQRAVGTTNWNGLVMLPPGGNVIHAYAVDAAGNCSATSSVPVVFWNMAQLTVQTNQPGWGRVSPNWNNAWLVINTNYTLTATAASGFRFTHWTSNFGLATNTAALRFTMLSNLVLTANFVAESASKAALISVTPHMPPPAPRVVLVTNPRLSAGRLGLSLQIYGAVSATILASTNLTSWDTLTNFTGTNTTINFCDPAASNFSSRFYRAVGTGN